MTIEGARHVFDPSKHCHDCGVRPIWRHASVAKCRSCYERGGGVAYVEIDLDLLDGLLGDAGADVVLEQCRRRW